MNPTLLFTIFCLESYKTAHGLTGKEALRIFNQYKVFDYVHSMYDVLHSFGQEYIVQDIEQYIRARR